ncbi:MAG: CDP-alcohol phosphatidyltransferase family protein, partial [Chloroflexi bacterium]|nr:CDP-alcohol phosphatidyltransferase family protein [Chloroflexota bacterium]
MNVANLVSVGRVAMALAVLYLLWLPGDAFLWTASALTAVVIYLDALDGYLARKLGIASKIGGILDIAGDVRRQPLHAAACLGLETRVHQIHCPVLGAVRAFMGQHAAVFHAHGQA